MYIDPSLTRTLDKARQEKGSHKHAIGQEMIRKKETDLDIQVSTDKEEGTRQ